MSGETGAGLAASDHTAYTIADGTPVVCRGTMVGVPAGTPAVLRHASPSGHTNPRSAHMSALYWAELDDYIYWSHGRSESKGYWGTAAEFDVVTSPGEGGTA